jgi:hypothetical protein
VLGPCLARAPVPGPATIMRGKRRAQRAISRGHGAERREQKLERYERGESTEQREESEKSDRVLPVPVPATIMRGRSRAQRVISRGHRVESREKRQDNRN